MFNHVTIQNPIQKQNIIRKKVRRIGVTSIIATLIIMAGCNQGEGNNAGTDTNSGNNEQSIMLSLNLPNSLTGTSTSSSKQASVMAAATQSTGVPCAFYGPEGEDIFRNGYEMTKFMLSAVATWTCITDRLVELSEVVPHDGVLYETENDFDAIDYDPEDPTHYSVTDDSESQTSVRLYYGYSRFVPPLAGDKPQFYISWVKQTENDYSGRLIIDATKMNADNHKAEDPTMMRMDFSHSSEQQFADMFLRFDNGNEWADGLRISVSKDLNASPVAQVFTAKGLLAMKRQFFAVEGIDELPTISVMTVSDGFGNGAAIADYENVALPLLLNAETNNHLGNYIFNKTDIYAFEDDGDWDWIYKTFSSASYRGSRTTPAVGGTMEPFNPSLEAIAYYLGLNTTEQAYFSGDACNAIGDDCTTLLNAIFQDGFGGQEQNQGTDPQDWRSAALASPAYLVSVYPNGLNWDGAFDLVYVP